MGLKKKTKPKAEPVRPPKPKGTVAFVCKDCSKHGALHIKAESGAQCIKCGDIYERADLA